MLSFTPPQLAREAPVVRSVAWVQVVPILVLAIVPIIVTVVRGRTDLSGAVVVWTVVTAGVFVYAYDEPARAVLDASPTSGARRTAVRFALIGVASCVIGVAAAVLIVASPAIEPFQNLDNRLAEAAATSGVGLAVTAVRVRRGTDRISVAEAAVGPLVVLFVSALSARFNGLPTIGAETYSDRWWFLAAAGAIVVLRVGRESYRVHRPVRILIRSHVARAGR